MCGKSFLLISLSLPLVVALCCPAGGVEPAGPDSVVIAQGDVAEAAILVAEDAPEPERHAAAELARFLQEITGASFETVSQAAAGKPRLLVGPEAAALAVPGFSTQFLAPGRIAGVGATSS